MAEKQNGYTAFPNTLIDKFMPILTGAEWKVLDVIIRKTLGWHKVWDEISASQFHSKTGVSKKAIWAIVTGMEERKLIQVRRVKENGRRAKNEYALMYSDMQKAEELVTLSDISPQVTYHQRLVQLVTLCDTYYVGLVTSGNTQKKALKETIQKKEEKPVVPTSQEKELAALRILFDQDGWDYNDRLALFANKIGKVINEHYECAYAERSTDRATLIQLGLTYTDEEIIAAVSDTAAPGRNIDGPEWVLEYLEGE